MKADTKVAIAILNWNGKDFLAEFLPLVVQYSSSEPGVDIVVIDNDSTDESLNYLRNNFADITLIELDKNYGFAEGYNRGLSKVKAEYYLLLNSDVKVTPGWLTPLTDFMDNNSGCAAVMPSIRSLLRPEYFEYAGAAGGFIDKYGYPFCRGRIFSALEKDTSQYTSNVPVFWTTGAAMMVRSSLWHSLGGFDDLFFAHMEEIDFCWRLKNAGHQLFVVPASKVYHHGGGALPKENPYKTFLNFRNNLLLIYKNRSKNEANKILWQRNFLDMLALLAFIAQGRFSDARAVLKARSAFRKMVVQNRDQLQKYRPQKSPIFREMYPRSIIYDFYLRGKKKFSDLSF